MLANPPLTDVEATAVLTAFFRYRATEAFLKPCGALWYSSPFDRHIVDRCMPLEEQAELLDKRGDHMLGIMLARTAEIDSLLLDAVNEHKVNQVVILGAGLDTRAWRLTGFTAGASQVRVFEVDTGSVEALKTSLLAGFACPCQRIFVQADLVVEGQLQQQLRGAGHDPAALRLGCRGPHRLLITRRGQRCGWNAPAAQLTR